MTTSSPNFDKGYPSDAVSLLTSIFSADSSGNCGVLAQLVEPGEGASNSMLGKLAAAYARNKGLINPGDSGSSSRKSSLTLSTSSSFSSSSSSSSSSPSSSPVFQDVMNLVCPPLFQEAATTLNSTALYYRFAISTINGQSYSEVPHASTLNAVAIALYGLRAAQPGGFSEGSTVAELDQSLPGPVVFVPAHRHYQNLALSSPSPSPSPSLPPPSSSPSPTPPSPSPAGLARFSAAIRLIQHNRLTQDKIDKKNFRLIKSTAKKLAIAVSIKIGSLKKNLDAQTDLSGCWRAQKNLERAEAEYDAARLQTIPQNLSIKLVGEGFKVGVGAIWLENINVAFSVSMVPRDPKAAESSSSKENPHNRTAIIVQVGSDSQLGVVSFRASNIFLKSDNFPTEILLDTFEAKCEFTAHVPIHFKTERQQWKVGPEMKINLKTIKSKMQTSGGLAAKPPQSLIRFAAEQIMKVIITKNLRKFFPPEIGDYMETASSQHKNSLAGTLGISGPRADDLESHVGENGASCARARELLHLDASQAALLVQFARGVAGVDVSTTVKLVQYYKDNVVMNKNQEAAADLVVLWQHGFDLFAKEERAALALEGGGGARAAPIDFRKLFHTHVKNLSENPIKICMELTHIDYSLEVQPILSSACRMFTRLLYENFGGAGVVGENADEDAPDDALLLGVRRSMNSIFVPLRRAFFNAGKSVKRVMADVVGKVAGKPKTVASLSLVLKNLQVFCTPSLPISLVDYMCRQYEATCRIKMLDGGKRRLVYKLAKVDESEDKGDKDEAEEGEAERDEGEEEEEEVISLPKFVMSGHVDNASTIVAFDPKQASERGSVKLSMMPSFHGVLGMKTEDSLKETCAALSGDEEPLRAIVAVDELRTQVPLMAMVAEFMTIAADLLKWGGASFGTERRNESGLTGEEPDERMIADMSDTFKRIMVILMKILHKHTSMEAFQMKVASSLRLSSDSCHNLTVDVQGTANSKEDEMPLSLEWTATFVDIVEDMRRVVEEFRKGQRSEIDAAPDGEVGGKAGEPSTKKPKQQGKGVIKKGRRGMSKIFGDMFTNK